MIENGTELLVESVTLCHGHLAEILLSLSQNQVKLCTFKDHDDVQLTIFKFWLSIKECSVPVFL